MSVEDEWTKAWRPQWDAMRAFPWAWAVERAGAVCRCFTGLVKARVGDRVGGRWKGRMRLGNSPPPSPLWLWELPSHPEATLGSGPECEQPHRRAQGQRGPKAGAPLSARANWCFRAHGDGERGACRLPWFAEVRGQGHRRSLHRRGAWSETAAMCGERLSESRNRSRPRRVEGREGGRGGRRPGTQEEGLPRTR